MADNLEVSAKLKQLKMMSTALHTLRMSDTYSDASIICEGITYPVHRLVLHASSPYFAALFQTDMREAATCKVTLDAIDGKVLKLILDFIYTGNAAEIRDEETLMSVIAAAHFLQVDVLYDHCWSKLIPFVSSTHFIKIWNLAEFYGNVNVMSGITNLVADKFAESTKSNDFYLMNASQMKSVLSCEKLSAAKEIVFVETITWFEYLKEARDADLPALLDMIEVDNVSNDFLVQLTTDPVVMNCTTFYHKCVSLSLSRLRSNKMDVGPKIHFFTGGFKIFTYNLEEKKYSSPKYLPRIKSKTMASIEWEGCIYFLGDKDNHGLNGRLYPYIPLTNSAQPPGVLKVSIELIKLAIFEGCLYVFGREKNKTQEITVQKHDFVSQKCSLVGRLPVPSCDYDVLTLGGNLYIIFKVWKTIKIMQYRPSDNSCWIMAKTTISDLTSHWISTVYEQRLHIFSDNNVHVYDPRSNEIVVNPFCMPDDPDLQIVSASNLNKKLPFIVFCSPKLMKFALFRVDRNSVEEVPWPSIEGDTFWTCVLTNN